MEGLAVNQKIFKSEAGRIRMEEWYQRFLKRTDISVKSTEIETSFGKNHVLTAGDSSNPPLVCLHAMLTSSAHLISELSLLSKQFYIIAPDLPGQSVRGLPVRLPYTDDSHARWLREVTDGIGIQQSHLLGISLGGFAARQFASAYPERVTSLSLIVPAGIVQGSLVKGFSRMAWPMIIYKLKPTPKRLRNFAENLITTWDEEWAEYLGDSFNHFTASLKIPPVASDEELRNLRMHCLVIGAEYDISFPGGEMIERVENNIPDVETELLKDSRHCPPTTPEFRDWLGKRLTTFIDKSISYNRTDKEPEL